MSSQTPDTRATYVRLSVDEREALEALAAASHRTLSGEIRLAIEAHLRAKESRRV